LIKGNHLFSMVCKCAYKHIGNIFERKIVLKVKYSWLRWWCNFCHWVCTWLFSSHNDILWWNWWHDVILKLTQVCVCSCRYCVHGHSAYMQVLLEPHLRQPINDSCCSMAGVWSLALLY